MFNVSYNILNTTSSIDEFFTTSTHDFFDNFTNDTTPAPDTAHLVSFNILNTTSAIYDFINTSTQDFSDNFTNGTTLAPGPAPDTAHLAVRDLIYNHLGPFVCIFGMLTNILNLIVLTQNQLPESPYTHLTGLACTDFGALFLSFVYMGFSKDSFAYEWKFFDAYIFYGCVNICTTSSVWITVQLTIERFLFVRHPLWAKDTCDRASAKFKVLTTVCAAAVFNIPRFFTLFPKEHNGQTVLGSTAFRTSDLFFAMNWAYSICVHFIPLVILGVANSYLVYAVHRAGQERQRLQIRNNREAAWQREQRRLTITLISIVFLFLVCILPNAFADRPIAYAIFGGSKTEREFVGSSFYLNLQYIGNFLVWCELSLNFVLYVAFNEKFRRVLRFTAQRVMKKFQVPFCRRKDVLLQVKFKSGPTSTRNSLLNTNTMNMNSKGSVPQQEQQPLNKLAENGDVNEKIGNDIENGETPFISQTLV